MAASNHLNFVNDGYGLMSPTDQATFVAKNLLIHCIQGFMPLRQAVAIDTAKFLSAFSFIDEDGTQQEVENWPNAPQMTPSHKDYASMFLQSLDFCYLCRFT